MFVAPQRSAGFEPDTMTKSSVPPNAPVALPPLVAAYVEATNSFDLERLMANFQGNDARRHRRVTKARR
jgi:hypothetical protein